MLLKNIRLSICVVHVARYTYARMCMCVCVCVRVCQRRCVRNNVVSCAALVADRGSMSGRARLNLGKRRDNPV